MKTFFFFEEHLCLCPWSLALASSIPVLGLESVCHRKGCPWPWPRIFFVSLALASSLVSSTPPLVTVRRLRKRKSCWHVIALPQASIAAPTVMQGFEAKKKTAPCISFPIPYTPYSSIPRNRDPSAN